MKADKGEVEMILNNLLSNAVKFNRDGGKVDVALRAEAGKVMISVVDTGIGMTPEESARLFNDFVRIKNEKTRNIPGSGLGLSIVRKLVDLYEGTVDVASRPDAGSIFTVVLNQPRPAEAEAPEVHVAAR
jgi:signal transduction histidine kinase